MCFYCPTVGKDEYGKRYTSMEGSTNLTLPQKLLVNHSTMIQLTDLEYGDVLKEKRYGTEWEVTGVITEIATGDRIGVSVTEAREGSLRMDRFDQEDLTRFTKKAQ